MSDKWHFAASNKLNSDLKTLGWQQWCGCMNSSWPLDDGVEPWSDHQWFLVKFTVFEFAQLQKFGPKIWLGMQEIHQASKFIRAMQQILIIIIVSLSNNVSDVI